MHREWFKDNGSIWIGHEVIVYLKFVQDLIATESDRLKRYRVLPSTEENLSNILTEVLIQTHVKDLLDRGCKQILESGNVDDLRCMFQLFARTADGLSLMAAFLLDHILKLGGTHIHKYDKTVDEAKETSANVGGGSDSERKKMRDKAMREAGKTLINNFVVLWSKYLDMVITIFDSNQLFQTSLENALYRLLNNQLEPNKVSTLLASYCDDLLVNGEQQMSEGEFELRLEHVSNLVKLIVEKDLFIETYRLKLAKR